MSVQEEIHVSVVSHGQSSLVALLLDDFERHCRKLPLSVTVTLNIPAPVGFDPQRFSFPIEVKCNRKPQGFAANHNAVFCEVKKSILSHTSAW